MNLFYTLLIAIKLMICYSDIMKLHMLSKQIDGTLVFSYNNFAILLLYMMLVNNYILINYRIVQ